MHIDSVSNRADGAPGRPSAAAGAEKALAAEKGLAAIRLAVLVHATLVYHFLMDRSGTHPGLAYLLLALAGVYSLVIYGYAPYRRYPVMRSSYFISLTDAGFVTLWLYATGGVQSPFYVVLYGAVIAMAFRFSARATLLAAGLYAASYLALLAGLGQVGGYRTEITVRLGYVFLVAATGALFAREALHQTTAKLDLHNLTQRLEQEVRERERMQAELAEAQRRLAESREGERLHLAQELHDGPVQDLYAVSFQLGALAPRLPGEASRQPLAEVQTTLRQVIQTLRAICGELRPPTLAPFGLEVAIRSHAEGFQQAHAELQLHLDLMPDGQTLPERVRLALFRIYQQALNNVAQHARARSVRVRWAFDAQAIVLEIQDDGGGFDVPRRWIELARRGHLGLLGAAERAEAIGGRLEVLSAPGQGTVVRVVAARPAPEPTTDAGVSNSSHITSPYVS